MTRARLGATALMKALASIAGRRIRVRVALAALVTIALLSNGRFLLETLQSHVHARRPDVVERYEVRFAPLKPWLPPRGVVGYLSDRPTAVGEFYLTQHALAPLVVEHTSERPLVVGNFFNPATAASVGKRQDLVVLRDFGHGVVLFGRRQ